MSGDREEAAIEAQTAEEPAVVAEEMQEATQRLRDQAWKLNALTQTPMIPEDALAERTATPEIAGR
jgi:hypothetical protein